VERGSPPMSRLHPARSRPNHSRGRHQAGEARAGEAEGVKQRIGCTLRVGVIVARLGRLAAYRVTAVL